MEATYVTLETNSRHFIVEISTSIVPIKDVTGTLETTNVNANQA